MARTHARIYMSVWGGDFRLLTKDGQRLYIVLLTQAEINNCGVLPFVDRKWARLAVDETPVELEAALAILIDRRFLVLDRDTDELLIRTYIRHDGVERVPQLK